MKTFCRLLLLTTFVGVCNYLPAQQLPVFALNRYTQAFYNPATAGMNNETSLSVNYRQQWTGFNNAPETFLVGLDGRLNDRMGAGISLYNDISDIFGQSGSYVYYSYKIHLFKKHALSFGLSAGFRQIRIYFDKINVSDPDESSLLENSQSVTRFDAGAGLLYQFGKLSVQVSSLQLFHQNYTYEQQNLSKLYNYQLINHLFATVGYMFEWKNQLFGFTPECSLRNFQGSPLQFDFAVTGSYLKMIYLTLGYRQYYNFYSSVNVTLFRDFSVAYAYEMPGKDFRGISSGSHEVMLVYRFHKRSSSDGSDRMQNKEIKQIRKQNQQLFQETERLQIENERLVKQLAMHDSMVAGQAAELKKLREIFEHNRQEVEHARAKYEVDMSDIDSISRADTIAKENTFYVIVGAYLNLADAKFFQKVLEREIGLQTLVFAREDGKYYFVYTRQVKNNDEVNREMKRLKRLKIDNYINGNCWIYGEK
jgi:type IX secretion system PorP/SprF family membrane protein